MAHSISFSSTASSNGNMLLVTPPVEVITTTITIRGCSRSTSTWRISAVSSGGAVTTASRFVTCDIISVVLRRAASTSFRTCDRSIGSRAAPSGCSSSWCAYSR